jgi:hypothetical protein
LSIQNFWQSYPAELQVQIASSSDAQLTAWMWSPEAAPMDLRHYDTRAHGLEASYEDVQPGDSTPFGIARTSELTLWPASSVPAKAASAAMARTGANAPMLVASPQYYHDVRAFGMWSVRDTSTPFRAAIENGLDTTLNQYVEQVDQRNWYGFWNYGDVVHSFDVSGMSGATTSAGWLGTIPSWRPTPGSGFPSCVPDARTSSAWPRR